MTTLKELRQLSLEELRAQLNELKRNYFHLRLKHATRENNDTAALRAERRSIARVLTLIREKELAAGRQ